MSECTHDCSSCSQDCGERDKTSMLEKPHAQSRIKKVIGIVSGKGGVGKSIVSSILAVNMNRKGFKTAVLDADITGPSIPKAFGIKEKAAGSEEGIFPAESATGINIMSVNLMLENDTDPVIAGVVKQFWTDVMWGDIDYMFVDMPPGTGDVPLTVFQSIPVDGIIVVTSPQELVSMIVAKAVKMAEMMDIPVIGIVENMSYAQCPDCGKKINIFGESKLDKVAEEYNLKVLGRLPIDPKLAAACDKGAIELYSGNWLDEASDIIESVENRQCD